MKRFTHVLLALGALGVGGAGVLLRCARGASDVPGPPSADVERARGEREVTSEAAELAELRRELSQLRRQVHAQEEHLASVVAVPGTPGETQERDPRTDLELREEAERKHREYMAERETSFRKEPEDPRWAAATAAALHAAMADDRELRASARSVECRSSTCRLELTDDGSGRLDRLVPRFAMHVAQELRSATATRVQDPSGAVTMVLYMSSRDEAVVSR